MKVKPKEESYKFWDGVSGWSKAETAATSTLAGWINRRFWESARPSATVLDFGCGTGTITLRMARNVGKIYGVDVSVGMLRRAEQNLTNQNVDNAVFRKITRLNEMFGDDPFEMVTCFNVLQYVSDRRRHFGEFYRMLKSGGTLIIALPCFADANTLSTFFTRSLKFLRIMPETYYFGVNEIESEITSSGFTILESTDLTNLPERLIVVRKH